jgi:nickel transport protein
VKRGNRMARFAISVTMGWIVLALPAHAHKLSIFATASGNHIQGKVYFPSGGAANQTVCVVDVSGATLAETVSDAEGEFAMPAPSKLPLTLVSETVDGHRAEFVVDEPRAESAAQQAIGAEAASGEAISEERIRAVVQDELRPLREQLAEQSERSRARDIFGGIGYIAGVFGLIVLIKRGSRKSP